MPGDQRCDPRGHRRNPRRARDERRLGADETGKGLAAVQGDRVQLLQVMVNLIINAVEEMSPHAAGARDLVIRTVKTKSGSVLVAVCDSGPGVDPENLDRIFDAFFTTKGLPLTADMLEFRASSARGQELLSRAS